MGIPERVLLPRVRCCWSDALEIGYWETTGWILTGDIESIKRPGVQEEQTWREELKARARVAKHRAGARPGALVPGMKKYEVIEGRGAVARLSNHS